jgi:SnoaL-like domain
MDDIERLIAVEDIRRLKARYFRCMDTKDWDGFRDVFAADAEMDMRAEAGEAGLVRGAPEIAAFVRGAVDTVVTAHHGHMPEIDVTSPTTATGVWAMEDVLRWPTGGPITDMHGWGHYHETYVKRDGGWLIHTLTLIRLRVDFG